MIMAIKSPHAGGLFISYTHLLLVFIGLMVLAAIILLIVSARRRAGKNQPAAAPAASPQACGLVPAPGSSGEIMLHTVDDRTAAMLMAIVADEIDKPLNELRFVSIRELERPGRADENYIEKEGQST